MLPSTDVRVSVPKHADLIDFMKSQATKSKGGSYLILKNESIPEVLKRLNFFLTECEKTQTTLTSAKVNPPVKGSLSGGFSELRDCVAIVDSFNSTVHFRDSTEKNAEEKELLSVMSRISHLASLLNKEDETAMLDADDSATDISSEELAPAASSSTLIDEVKEGKKKVNRKEKEKVRAERTVEEKIGRIKTSSKRSTTKARLLYKLFRTAQELKVSCKIQKDESEKKLKEVETHSHSFLEHAAKLGVLKAKQSPKETAEICSRFLNELASCCPSDSSFSGSIETLQEKLLIEMKKPPSEIDDQEVCEVFEQSLALYFEFKGALLSRSDELSETILNCNNDVDMIRSALQELPMFHVVGRLAKRGGELDEAVIKFIDPQAKYRVTHILNEPTSFAEKADKIACMLSDESVLSEECTWEEFGKCVMQWPLFADITGKTAKELNMSPLQSKFHMPKGMDIRTEVSKLLEQYQKLQDAPNKSINGFVCEYLLNFLDRQGTVRTRTIFEQEQCEAIRYRSLAAHLEGSEKFRKLATTVLGKPIGEKYRSEQFRKGVEINLLQSILPAEGQLAMVKSKLVSHGNFADAVIGELKAGNLQHAETVAMCFKLLFTSRYFKFQPEMFYSKDFKKSRENADFVNLFNAVGYYIQLKILEAENDKERENMISGLILAADSALNSGALNTALSIFSALINLRIDESRFPDVWKRIGSNSKIDETFKRLNETFGTPSKFGKFIEEITNSDKQLVVPAITRCLNKLEQLSEGYNLAENPSDKKLQKENLDVFIRRKMFRDIEAIKLWFNAWNQAKSIGQLCLDFNQEFALLSCEDSEDLEARLDTLSRKFKKH